MNSTNRCYDSGSTKIFDRTKADQFVSVFSMLTLVFGSFGNIFTMLVIAVDKSMKGTTRLLFFVHALFDQISLFVNEVRLWFKVTYQLEIRNYNIAICKLQIFFSHFTVYMSVWMLLLISLERFCLMIFPTQKHPFKQMRHTVVILTVVIVVMIAENLGNLQWRKVCEPVKSVPLSVYRLVFLLEVTSCYFLPFIVTVIITFILLCKAFRRNRIVSSAETTGQARFRTVTIMLLGVVLSQLILGSLGISYSLLRVLGTFCDLKIGIKKNSDIHNCLVAFTFLNNGINFYIYILSAQGFRRTVFRQLSVLKSKVMRVCQA